ncbi:Flagellar biosynthesis protein FliR, partial [hydrothermal vent metagenome]
GQMIAMQSGLGFAQSFDPSQGRQSAIFATFLNLTAVVLIFTTGLHHMFLTGLVGSYDLIPVGSLPSGVDVKTLATDTVAQSFRLGIQISAPLIAFGLIFYLSLGVLSRLMPQVQIFFVAMPLNVLVGIAIFALSFGAMMGVWLRYLESYGASLN